MNALLEKYNDYIRLNGCTIEYAYWQDYCFLGESLLLRQ